jgi:DNA anti-recombination protein RmuC
VVSSVDQRPTAVQQSSSSANFAASGTGPGASLMEVSAFMTEQLKAQVVEQRAHDNEQHAEMIRLLVEREAKLEEKLEAQREGYETKLEEQRKESETKLEAQRKDLEAKFRSKLEKHRCETQVQARAGEVMALQRRLEVLSESKLLEDEELSAIFDQVADAIGAGATEDGADRAWACVMQMVRLSEGIASEKMFAAQLRRKFL